MITMLYKYDDDLKWFKNAKLGLFIHWGLYSATEGYYNGKETPGIVEWIASKEHIPTDEYEKLAESMSCENFKPDEWAVLAKNAGMKYCVFTAKHHEGFAMYDTKYDDYSIVKRSPYGKDVAGAVTDAMRKVGIVPCFYYSQAIDFHERDAMGNTWDNTVPENERNFRAYIDGKCKFQLKELLENYGDIGLIWMDVPKGMTKEIALDLKRYVKSLQPKCLVSGRIGGTADMGDYGCFGDNQIPVKKSDYVWETASTMNDTWGYKRDDHNFKSADEIIKLLCSVVSKGANLLLNIGPDKTGNIPNESIEVLNELAKWMKINSESIHDTKESPFNFDFSFGTVASKENNLYFFVKDKADELTVYGLLNRVLKVEVLGDKNAEFSNDGFLKIKLDNAKFNKYVTVVKVVLDGEPKIKDGVFAQEKDIVMLNCSVCKLFGDESKHSAAKIQQLSEEEAHNMMLVSDVGISESGVIENWFDENTKAVWEFESFNEGEYEVVLYTLAQKYMPWVGGHKVTVKCNGEISAVLKEDIIPDGANRKYFAETGSLIGKVRLMKNNKLELYANEINYDDPVGLAVSRIELRKVK